MGGRVIGYREGGGRQDRVQGGGKAIGRERSGWILGR